MPAQAAALKDQPAADTQAGPTKTVVDKVYIAPTPPPKVIKVRDHTTVQAPTQNTTANTPPRASRDDGSETEQEPADHEGGSGEHHESSGGSEHGDD